MKKLYTTLSILALVASLAFAFTASAAHYADGVRAYWNMDDGAGTSANEQVHNLDGTLTNGATWGSSAPLIGSSGGLSLDGVDDYVAVAHDSELDMTGAYSMSVWLNVADVATYRPILFRGTTNSNDIEVYVQSGSGDLIVAHNRGNSGTFDFVGFDNPPVGTYFHLVVTYDGTDVKAYYNDVAAAVVQGTTAVAAPLDTDNGWWMGKVDHTAFGGTFYFSGLMDDVRIYDTALTATEITRLNNYGSFTLDVTPDSDTNPLGTDHTVTITLDTPLSFIPVLYSVSGNVAPGENTQYIYTDENGQIIFTYTGLVAGTDTITGCIDVSWFTTGGGICNAPFPEPSDTATKTWLDYFDVSGTKYQDSDADGIKDGGEIGLENWLIFVDEGNGEYDGGEPSDLTDSNGYYEFSLLDLGTYSICEEMPDSSWLQTSPGTPTVPTCHSVTLAGADDPDNDFGNVHLVPTDGKTKGFWTNKNGKAVLEDDGGVVSEMGLLSGLNLVDESGDPFDPTDYATLKTWLNKARAKNMAYMLSAQLASAVLAVEAVFLSPSTIIWAPDPLLSPITTPLGFITVGELITEANGELGLHNLVPAGDPFWPYQNALRAILDAVNSQAVIAVGP